MNDIKAMAERANLTVNFFFLLETRKRRVVRRNVEAST